MVNSRNMKIVLRVGFVLLVCVGVGWGTARAVRMHATAGTPVAQVRLSSAMAGLFAGGAAAVVLGIALMWGRSGRQA
jgi:hypothetical protein